MRPKLELRNIGKSFGNQGQGADKFVIKELSLYVGEGEFVSIIGPSGSGKSTVFHMIGGLLRPDHGEILLDGRDITGKRGHISYVPQQHSLLPWRTVLENTVLAIEVSGGMSKKQSREKAREWLARVGLKGYESAYPDVLSGGMQQRVAFLRALLSPQEVMCLDEPFGALDALTRMDMQRWLLGLWEQTRRSVLFVTHSIEEALFLSDRIYVFSEKPTGVLEEIIVPFQRPRGEDILQHREFIRLRAHIYSLMKKEVTL
ncbi:MAG: ABC transporter ATP-binding protein [Paenibacillaceae bacterium]